MRRMCGLSSQIRNRSLLKSMRYMVRPRGHTGPNGIPGVNHIAAPVNEWLPGEQDPEKWTPVFRKDHAKKNRAGASEPDFSIRTARAGYALPGCDRGRTAS